MENMSLSFRRHANRIEPSGSSKLNFFSSLKITINNTFVASNFLCNLNARFLRSYLRNRRNFSYLRILGRFFALLVDHTDGAFFLSGFQFPLLSLFCCLHLCKQTSGSFLKEFSAFL